MVLRGVRTQYVIRNLETHSMELDILAEQDNGDVVGIEIQMYEESAPFKRTRYYLSGIDMSVLEKGRDYDELPAVTMVYITKKDFIDGGSGCYLIERKASRIHITRRRHSHGLWSVSNISRYTRKEWTLCVR